MLLAKAEEHCLLMTRAMSFVASLLPNWIVSGPR